VEAELRREISTLRSQLGRATEVLKELLEAYWSDCASNRLAEADKTARDLLRELAGGEGGM
jgi:hypothetical protein